MDAVTAAMIKAINGLNFHRLRQQLAGNVWKEFCLSESVWMQSSIALSAKSHWTFSFSRGPRRFCGVYYAAEVVIDDPEWQSTGATEQWAENTPKVMLLAKTIKRVLTEGVKRKGDEIMMSRAPMVIG